MPRKRSKGSCQHPAPLPESKLHKANRKKTEINPVTQESGKGRPDSNMAEFLWPLNAAGIDVQGIKRRTGGNKKAIVVRAAEREITYLFRDHDLSEMLPIPGIDLNTVFRTRK